jgi:hypothetical protein
VATALNSFAPTVGEKAQPFLAGFLFLWWFCGIAVCTFKLPFNDMCFDTANGYIATWLAFLAASKYFMEVPQIEALITRGQSAGGSDGDFLVPLAIASLVCMAQAAYYCSELDFCPDTANWAIACGVISIVVCLVVMLVPQVGSFKRFVYLFLFVWWGAAVATLTFTYENCTTGCGMYAKAGNGYFATWSAFFISFLLTYVAFVGDDILGGGDAAEASEDTAGGEITPSADGVTTESNPTSVEPGISTTEVDAAGAEPAATEEESPAEAEPDTVDPVV